MTPLYPQKLALNFVDKWRSISRYSSLAEFVCCRGHWEHNICSAHFFIAGPCLCTHVHLAVGMLLLAVVAPLASCPVNPLESLDSDSYICTETSFGILAVDSIQLWECSFSQL
jgi:hypothetical protein